MTTVRVLEVRLEKLEKALEEHEGLDRAVEGRVRALEIAQAKIIAFAAGGAFAGGGIVQLLQWMFAK
jgi:hypothetical protein